MYRNDLGFRIYINRRVVAQCRYGRPLTCVYHSGVIIEKGDLDSAMALKNVRVTFTFTEFPTLSSTISRHSYVFIMAYYTHSCYSTGSAVLSPNMIYIYIICFSFCYFWNNNYDILLRKFQRWFNFYYGRNTTVYKRMTCQQISLVTVIVQTILTKNPTNSFTSINIFLFYESTFLW